MTSCQEEQIKRLRQDGCGYKKIAQALGLSVDAVKYFCRKHKTVDVPVCLSCGKSLVQVPKRKPRKFCSNECRENWWNKNRNKGNKPTGEIVRCVHCGKEFSAYKRENRKYCSHACYVAERFQGGDGHE